jgi:hypothetical protein
MNINNLLIIFIILFLITMIYFIINIFKQKIETFDEQQIINDIPLPNITDDSKVTILSQTSLSLQNSIDGGTTKNTVEALEITDSVDMYSLSSSFIASQGQILSLFKINPQPILLTSVPLYTENRSKKNIISGFGNPVSFYNYIAIIFPTTNISGTKIEISYSNYTINNPSDFNTDDSNAKKDIKIYTGDDSSFTLLDSNTFTSNSQTTLTFNILDKLIKSNIYIFISPVIKSITLTKIRFYVKEIQYLQLKLDEKDIIKFTSDNDAEQITIPSTIVIPDTKDTEIGIGTPISNNVKLNNLFKIIVPWAIYDGKDYDSVSKTIPEALNRNCKAAKIFGTDPIKVKEDNIEYLSGTTDTVVEFPNYSLPEYHTICVITKYTNKMNDITKRGRIITSTTSGTNWLLGHHWGVTGVMHNGDWKTTDTESLSADKNEWIVSCVKSSASTNNTILFNGINRANKGPGRIYNYSGGKRITINIDNYGQHSDFGLSYLIIWDVILSDNQLKLVSETLQDYLKTGVSLNLSNISISVNDGSTKDKAAVSAVEIKKVACTTRNGLYWILPANGDKNNAKQVYCIMDDLVSGGGWMLALKAGKHSTTFNFHSPHWTNNTVLNDITANSREHEAFSDAKYDIYNYYNAVDCLAIFDRNDTNSEVTFITNPEYGWIWTIPRFYNNGIRISLLNYFKPKPGFPNGYSTYFYTSKDRTETSINRWMLDRGFSGTYVPPQYFENFLVNVTCKLRLPLNRNIFSQQEAFKAWGLNVIPQGWSHSARWGGSFNENTGSWESVPNTNDVSCGIGLQARNYSAGDVIGCCQSTAGTNTSMGFKWFIR